MTGLSDFSLNKQWFKRKLPIKKQHASFQHFRQCFFASTGFISNIKEASVITAIEALYGFFSNQHEYLGAGHYLAPATALAITHESGIMWLRSPEVIFAATIPTDLGAHYPYLPQLITACKQHDLAVNLVQEALSGLATLPSPFTVNKAYCQESYEVAADLNCLRFTDGHQCFFLLQLLSSADGLYFPLDNRLVVLAHVNESHAQRLQIKLVSQFADIARYASVAKRFGGVISSHSRPSHFYYDVWPALYEIAVEAKLAEQLPAIIMRKGHDFTDAALLLGHSNSLILDSDAIDQMARNTNQWFVHVGRQQHLTDSYRYYVADRFLLEKSLARFNKTVQAKINSLADCYPVVWLGVEGQKRCWLEQIQGYAAIINRLARRYPTLGVIFDGWTLPLTPSDAAKSEAEKDRQVMHKILALLDNSIKQVSIIGETSNNKLAVGQRADFFITNYSTGSLHISRFLSKPGFCHLSAAFADIALRLNLHRHPHHHVYLLPNKYVHDYHHKATTRHDYLSYSIAPSVFCRFIEQRLDKVLTSASTPPLQLFIEPSYSVSYDLRVFIKMATHGNVLMVGAGEDKIMSLTNYPEDYLYNQLVYGTFPVGSHQKAKLRAEYLVWLRDPLVRTCYHAVQLKAAAVAKNPSLTIAEIFKAGHKVLDNYYTRLLSGNLTVPFGQCTETMLETALNNLENQFVVIGIDEYPAKSYQWLCTVMDWDRTLFTETAPIRFMLAEGDFTDEVLHLATAINELDQRLYKGALAIFLNKIKQLN